MGRRRKCRRVQNMPYATHYKPQGTPLSTLQEVAVPVDSMEAFRLVDAEGLTQEEAAALMDVSRPTLCRMLAQARQTVATALSRGMAIRIEGGDFMLANSEEDIRQRACAGRGPGKGRRLGRESRGQNFARGGGHNNPTQ